MALRELDSPAGSVTPGLDLSGRLDCLGVESEALAGNPAGDPTRRSLYVYVPRPTGPEALPSVYLLQGFGGHVEEWLTADSQSTVLQALDIAIERGECPPALIVFVDGYSTRGTSQFLNSEGTGRYMDYVCDEVVAFIDERYASLCAGAARGLSGNSSGDYGALILSMLRPGRFSALAAHAPDALFECCYEPLFPLAARELRDRFGGSLDAFRRQVSIENWDQAQVLFAAYGTACCYTPDPQRPGEALLPFDPRTGRTIDAIWQRWLELDPVRLADRHAAALRRMKLIHIDAGRDDRFYLDLGARALSDELTSLGIGHTLELFEGTHDVPVARRVAAVSAIVTALSDR